MFDGRKDNRISAAYTKLCGTCHSFKTQRLVRVARAMFKQQCSKINGLLAKSPGQLIIDSEDA